MDCVFLTVCAIYGFAPISLCCGNIAPRLVCPNYINAHQKYAKTLCRTYLFQIFIEHPAIEPAKGLLHGGSVQVGYGAIASMLLLDPCIGLPPVHQLDVETRGVYYYGLVEGGAVQHRQDVAVLVLYLLRVMVRLF